MMRLQGVCKVHPDFIFIANLYSRISLDKRTLIKAFDCLYVIRAIDFRSVANVTACLKEYTGMKRNYSPRSTRADRVIKGHV